MGSFVRSLTIFVSLVGVLISRDCSHCREVFQRPRSRASRTSVPTWHAVNELLGTEAQFFTCKQHWCFNMNEVLRLPRICSENYYIKLEFFRKQSQTFLGSIKAQVHHQNFESWIRVKVKPKMKHYCLQLEKISIFFKHRSKNNDANQ